MGDLAVSNEERLSEIAVEIKVIQAQTRKVVLSASIEIGQRLAEAKEKAGHGNWEKWLAENTDISQSTAGNCIKMYEEYGVAQQSILGNAIMPDELMNKLSYTQGLALLGIKDPVERVAFAEANDVAEMSKRELQQAVKDLNKAKKEQKLAEEDAIAVRRDLREAEEKIEERDERLNKLQNERIVTENRIKELEGALADAKEANKQIEPAVVYEDTAETKAELDRLRVREAELKAELEAFHKAQKTVAPPAGEEVSKLKAKLETLQNIFNEASEIVGKMETADRKRYRRALIGFAEGMKEYQEELMKEDEDE